ncbi:glycoside hydrolase family 79 protein [Zasmidium cellare ATCC 36951]|uniref:Glycoside hydrolase family 79 protein n=1 Tax=Zasmidium cellare ATCC 36951 TaxID=1080233 RepID=A0A6A6CMD7_ZASCE|nr:glycoside hydrolase family 79 protein [Zasmidium cellare ATCC 36951]KAF2166606.1 glycoside hydrolase family 79 protein [Zasmidium cellare ATCC 36951]
MSVRSVLLTGLVKALLVYTAAAVTFAVPATPPVNASKQLLPAPIGVSIEFFAWPGYADLASTEQCLQNFQALTGTWPPLRIGGTTQDRATYNASSPSEVMYTIASPSDAPASLTYGPSFLSLAGTYNGSVILGLNRQLNNLSNTISAAKKAVAEIANLDAIELGNEPNFYSSSSPINTNGGSWTASDDFASQASWQAAVGGNLSRTNLVSAGVYFSTSGFSIQGLTAVEGNSKQFVKDYCSHNYPQSRSTANLPQLMNHSAISQQIAPFKAEIAAANSKGKAYIMGETNSATQGGGGISPMFGSGLWVMDYSLQLLHLGTESLYFHQGTIGNCPYCWWGRYSMGAPYYGAYFATLALAGADQIAPLDDFNSTYGGWAIYSNGQITKVLLYNSDYYATGTRSAQIFNLTGLVGCSSVHAVRLTAPFSTSRQDQGQNPTFGGQTFQNGTCAIQGTPLQETTTVSDGKASFTVNASEALLVYL